MDFILRMNNEHGSVLVYSFYSSCSWKTKHVGGTSEQITETPLSARYFESGFVPHVYKFLSFLVVYKSVLTLTPLPGRVSSFLETLTSSSSTHNDTRLGLRKLTLDDVGRPQDLLLACAQEPVALACLSTSVFSGKHSRT